MRLSPIMHKLSQKRTARCCRISYIRCRDGSHSNGPFVKTETEVAMVQLAVQQAERVLKRIVDKIVDKTFQECRTYRITIGSTPEGMAERQGFEPWRRSPAYTLSRRAPSTTRPPLRYSSTAVRPPQSRTLPCFVGISGGPNIQRPVDQQAIATVRTLEMRRTARDIPMQGHADNLETIRPSPITAS